MADKQIKQYTENTTPAGADLAIIQQSSNDAYAKVQLSNLVVAGSVKPNSLKSGASSLNTWAWDTWTPSFTGLTVGTGATTDYYYIKIGNTVHYSLSITLGTSPAVGDIRFTLPVEMSRTPAARYPLGYGTLVDVSAGAGGVYYGVAMATSTTEARVYHLLSTSKFTGLASTIPFTWAAGDIVNIVGTYETA